MHLGKIAAAAVAVLGVSVALIAGSGKWLPFEQAPIGAGDSKLGEELSHEFENDPQFHDRLLAIAAEYRKFGRFDERLRFGPSLCDDGADDTETTPPPSKVRFSTGEPTDPHGSKLYYLFVKNQQDYGYLIKRQAFGQTVVKESWQPMLHESRESSNLVQIGRGGDKVVPIAVSQADGKCYRTGERSALFIMVKLDEATPGTDQGWVYGTVTPDGKRVTAAGRVSQCMNCHRDAPDDRMFGVNERQ